MQLHSRKNYLRTLTVAAAAYLFVVSSGLTQNPTVNPFTKFGGNWTGNGLIYLSNGSKERIRCRGGFTAANIVNIMTLKLELRCAGDSYNFELQSDLNYDGNAVTGIWTEITRGLNGKISGTINGDQIQAVAEGQTFTATFELINLGDKQQVRITSPGSELTDVLIGLIRSGTRPPPPQPPQQTQ